MEINGFRFENVNISAETANEKLEEFRNKHMSGKNGEVWVPENKDWESMLESLACLFSGRSVSMCKYVGAVNSDASGAVFNNGAENTTVSISLLDNWKNFNRKIFSGKNVKTLYVELSPEIIENYAWTLGFDSGVETVFAKEYVPADAAVISLGNISRFVAEKKNLSGLKVLVTIGDELLDFDDIKGKLGDVQWINYYAFPQCLCVSYSKMNTVGGKELICHQLKPVSDTSVNVTDENGRSVPANTEGFITQTIAGQSVRTNILAVLTTEKKMYALGYGKNAIYIGGKYFSKNELYRLLLESGKVNDAAISEDTVYYDLISNYNEFEIRNILAEKTNGKSNLLNYIEVPYICRRSDGKPDIEKLGKITSAVFEKKLIVNDALEREYSGDFYVSYDYENTSESILSEQNIHNTDIISDDVRVYDEPAVVTAEPIDYSKYDLKDIAYVIESRKESAQKIVYITQEGMSEQTYSELYRESCIAASGLLKAGIKAGDVLIFQIPDNRRYIISFWACMLIGAVAAPLGVLDDYGDNNLNTEKLHNIFDLLDNSYVLADEKIAGSIQKLLGSDKVISYKDIYEAEAADFEIYRRRDDEPCLMLFTSGSTGIPKGVGLSQKNIFARTIGEIEMYGLDSSISDFNWMTLTHAAGIIWSHIRDVILDAFQVQADTNTMLKDPLSILGYMSRFRSTTMWAPNFAFALIADNIDESKDYGWDLSRASNVYSGGETNVSKSLRLFLKKTEKYGFPKKGLIPCFGMTETSSCMTYYNNFSLETSSDDDRFIPIGTPAVSHSVRITDDNGNTVKKGEIGKIEYKGDTITDSYYKNPEANAESFTDDGYFITGDLGYIVGDDVVLTGRIKEMIIINGLNYYVQDIEAVVDSMDEVMTSFTTAVSVKSNAGTEEILIVFTPEKELASDEEIRALTSEIREHLLEKSGLYAKYIVPDLRNKSIRTEIGKKQRGKYRRNFYEGKYDDILRKTGVLKEEPYVMEEKWVRSELTEIMSAEDIIAVSDRSSFIIDRFVIDNLSADCGCFIDGLLERGRKWAAMTSGSVVLVPTVNGISVDGDSDININSALVNGFINSFNQENSKIRCIQADFDEYDESLAEYELFNNKVQSEAVYRNGRRYAREFSTVLADRRNTKDDAILCGGRIFVAGGMGGIGTELCRHLAEKYGASLIIAGRRPADEAVLNSIREKLHTGKEAVYVQCDVSDCEAVEKVFAEYSTQQCGKIDTVIDLAGSLCCADGSSFWSDIDRHKIVNEDADTFRMIIDSKLVTTLALEKSARKYGVENFILFGSVNGIQGGSGLSAYSAVNGFQNQYAAHISKEGGMNGYCINWSGWYGMGMSREIPDVIVSVSQNSGFRFANAEENLSYFDTAVENRLKNVIVGLDRENLKNRVVINDVYSPALSIYYSGYDSDLSKIVEGVRDDCIVNYIKVDEIVRNSENREDVNISELRRNILNISNSGAELNEDEKKMAEVWKKVLHLSRIGADDNFFELGGNSLILTKLAYEIENQLGIHVSVPDILINGSVRKLVKHLNAGDDSVLRENYEEGAEKLKATIKLDFDIAGKLEKSTAPAENSILFTFRNDIGCVYVIAGALEKYRGRKVYVLCNCESDREAEETVKHSLRKLGFDDACENDDLVIIAGDTTKKMLGLAESVYSKLCSEVEIVYHFAVELSIMSSYDSSKPMNIDGTNRIIEFCCDKSKKKLVFMSSLSIFKTITSDDMAECDETTRFYPTRDMEVGFAYSIYAADELVHLAADNGLDCVIFRNARLCGDSRTGKMGTEDGLWQLFKFVFAYKIIPNIDVLTEMLTPADIFAEQILTLSEAENNAKYKVYHIKGLDVGFDDFVEWFRTKDPQMKVMDYDEWLQILRDTSVQNNNALMMRMQGLFHKRDSVTVSTPAVKDEITLKIMAENGLRDISSDDKKAALDITYDYLNRIHFWEM